MIKKNFDLVIARYNEKLSWILDNEFMDYNIIVYNKGINDNFEKKNVKKIIKLNNVGMCDHTYLFHIITNYDNLSDITFFFPGSLNMEHKYDRALDIIYIVNKFNKGAFVASHHKNGIANDLYDFEILNHDLADENNKKINDNNKLIPANIRPFGKWFLEKFKSDINYVSYLGIFAMSKKDIIKYPVEYYKKLMTELEVNSNLEVAHYFERSWIKIFSPLYDTIIAVNYDNDDEYDDNEYEKNDDELFKLDINDDVKLLHVIEDKQEKQNKTIKNENIKLIIYVAIIIMIFYVFGSNHKTRND